MPNYLVWREHEEVGHAAESNRNEDEDRIDDLISDIGMEYQQNS